jgi:hypothetical protein
MVEKIILNNNHLTTLSATLIHASNAIEEFQATGNEFEKIEINFVWRLRRALKIEISGGCDETFDKANGDKFMIFYNLIAIGCT